MGGGGRGVIFSCRDVCRAVRVLRLGVTGENGENTVRFLLRFFFFFFCKRARFVGLLRLLLIVGSFRHTGLSVFFFERPKSKWSRMIY